MTIYKMEILVFDNEGYSASEVIENIERRIEGNVIRFQRIGIEHWDDDHPLNKPETFDLEYEKLFEKADYERIS